MPMFNTAAIRVEPLPGSSGNEFVRDATGLATRLRVSVVFRWASCWEFRIHPDSSVEDNQRALKALMDQEERYVRGDFKAPDELSPDIEKTMSDAQNALRGLNEPQEK